MQGIILQHLRGLPDHEAGLDPVVPAISGIGRRAHAQRHRVVVGRAQTREQVGILAFAETRQFIEANKPGFPLLPLNRTPLIVKIRLYRKELGVFSGAGHSLPAKRRLP
jgi:hypothetical protein